MPTFRDDAIKPKRSAPPRDDAPAFPRLLQRQRALAVLDLGPTSDAAPVAGFLAISEPNFAKLRLFTNPTRGLGVDPDGDDAGALGRRILAALPAIPSPEAFEHATATLRTAIEIAATGPLTRERLARRMKRDADRAARRANALSVKRYNETTSFRITRPYAAGALAVRTGLVRHNPYEPDTAEHLEWSAGSRNEHSQHHFVDGHDVVTAAAVGRAYVFAAPKYLDDGYASAIATASGVYDLVQAMAKRPDDGADMALRDRLALEGHVLGGPMLDCLLQRIHLDRARRGRALTFEEEAGIARLTPAFRDFIAAAGDVEIACHRRGGSTKYIGRRAGRSKAWGAAISDRMNKAGLGFLVDTSRNGWFSVTHAGWTVYARLKTAQTKQAQEPVQEAAPGPRR